MGSYRPESTAVLLPGPWTCGLGREGLLREKEACRSPRPSEPLPPPALCSPELVGRFSFVATPRWTRRGAEEQGCLRPQADHPKPRPCTAQASATCFDAEGAVPGCDSLPSFTSCFSSAQTWKKSGNTEANLAGKSDSPASARRPRALHTGLQRPPSRPRASVGDLCAWNVLRCTDPAGGSECQQHSKIETNCTEGKCGWTLE